MRIPTIQRTHARRGIFYSLTAVVLITAILFLTLLSSQPKPQGISAPVEISRLTSIMHTFEQDAQRSYAILTTRAFLSLIAYVTNTTQPVPNVTLAFTEALLNGSINGTPNSLMQDTTLSDWLNRLNTTLNLQRTLLNVTITNITIAQTSPWDVTSTALLSYTLRLGNARYDRTIQLTHTMSIIGLEDPLYTIYSYGRLPNIIFPATTRDILRLINASMNNSLYIPSSLAPDYLKRLEGNTTPSPYGIESIANGELFILNGIIQYDGRSSIDYEYFTLPTPGLCVNNTPAWFRISSNHIPLYENSTIIPCS